LFVWKWEKHMTRSIGLPGAANIPWRKPS